MRYVMRSLTGIFLLCLTAGLLGYAVHSFYQGLEARSADPGRTRGDRERVFTVTTGVLTPQDATPVITAFGEVSSLRSLEIRAEVAGRVLELAEAFRDGGAIEAGAILLRVDPAQAQSAVDIARAEQAEAIAQRTETDTRVTLAEADLRAAQQTRVLRAQALERQQAIQNRGAGTSAAVEDAEIALASADQAVVGRQQALAQAQSALELAIILVDRRGIDLREAERKLSETNVSAPFDGLLSAATAVPGSMVSANESIGTLTDMGALEVAFRVSNAQFARLRNNLGGTEVEATLALGDIPISVSGRVDRAGAAVGDGQTGRLLYARLNGDDAQILRPGDFLTVKIREPSLADVAVIPATAVDATGAVLVVDDDGRLQNRQLRILRRQQDEVIVSGGDAGLVYVRERSPQLGEGIRVRAIPDGGVPADGATPPARPEETAALDLDPERRARLIAFVEENRRMPAEVKARLLGQLEAPQVPAQVVERLERRMGG
ncbi:MAG: HlyD family efflux transporter periplasmic adaptor subunit [Pseudomonadota bacterium]